MHSQDKLIMPHEIFISHASQDKKVADAMCARLEHSGIRCWVAPRDIRPGMTYGAEIVHAISNARVMVVILSGQANLSPHVAKEVERAEFTIKSGNPFNY
jgi:hypothetical protein